jgi:hypothetical protein
MNSNRLKRFANYGVGALALLLAGNIVRVWLPSAAALAAPVPYTVILEQVRIGQDGSARKVPAVTSVYALRSDGSTVTKFTGRTPVEIYRLIHLASGTKVNVRDIAEVKSTSGGGPPALRRPETQCLHPTVKETYLGEEKVAGFRAAKVAWNNTTHWFALDHGCALVRGRAIWSLENGGALNDGTATEKHLLALIPGEPDVALFHVPRSFREVAPSEWAHAGVTGEVPSPLESQFWIRADQQYNGNRAKGK